MTAPDRGGRQGSRRGRGARARTPSRVGCRGRRRWPPRSARTCRRSPGPAGTIEASATPLVSRAACATVSWMSTAWPAARKVTVEAAQASALNASAAPMTSRAARRPRGPRASRRASSSSRGRRAISSVDATGARQAMRGDPEAEDDDQQGHERGTQQDRAGHHAPNAQDDHRKRRDGHDHDRVDDAFHDDRAEDRRPADPLPLPERVTPVQLAEPGGQDVVGQIPDVRVTQDPPVGQRRDRRQEHPPARARAATSMNAVTTMTAIQAGDAVARTWRAAPMSTAWMRIQIEMTLTAIPKMPRASVRRLSLAIGVSRPGVWRPASVIGARATDGACSGGRPGASRARRRRCAGSRPRTLSSK